VTGARRAPAYPFEPRSNAYLEPGQFWAVPLSDGRFACGRVLAVPRDRSDPFVDGGTRLFLAGLMDWVGAAEPTAGDLRGSRLVAQGMAHVMTIRETGGRVLGQRDLEPDGVVGFRTVTHRAGGTVWVYEGARRVRAATRDEAARLPLLSTWGFKVIEVLAEARFVRGEPTHG
jgi:hypothetical protein